METQSKHVAYRPRSEKTSLTSKRFCLFAFLMLLAICVCLLGGTFIGTDLTPQARLTAPDSDKVTRSTFLKRSLLNSAKDDSHTGLQPRSSDNLTVTVEGGCYLPDKLQAPGLPEIHSVFSDHVSGQVVFVGLKLLMESWHEVEFRCEFANGEVSTVSAMDDRKSFGHFPQYVVVLTCPFPNGYRTRSRFSVTLTRLSWNPSYRNLTVCPTPKEKHFLAMCTMVKSMDSFIPQWLAYHQYLGVQHVYIYDNAIKSTSTLESTLRDYITQGFVTLVPWAHSVSTNKTYLEVQIAHENDCIWRHKHDADWMIKIDVDEYIQPMDAKRPRIPDYINDSIYGSVAAVRIQNWFFGHPGYIAPSGKSIIEKNRWRSKKPTLQNTGHDKNILRPINVHYFKVHSVKLGGDVISADPYTELRLVHYRTANRRARHFKMPKFTQKDDSMLRIREAIVEQQNQTNTQI